MFGMPFLVGRGKEMQKPRLESVEVRAIPDECPDTSWIGEYTNKASDWVICRHCGKFLHEAEFFNRVVEAIELQQYDIAYETERRPSDRLDKCYDALSVAREKFELLEHDCPTSHREYNYFDPYAGEEKEGTPNYRKYGKQDFERMEALSRGDWYFVGVVAKAIVRDANGQSQEFTSGGICGGIWGVESYAEEYIEGELKEEELDDLYDQLHKYGVDTDNWKELIEDIRVTW